MVIPLPVISEICSVYALFFSLRGKKKKTIPIHILTCGFSLWGRKQVEFPANICHWEPWPCLTLCDPGLLLSCWERDHEVLELRCLADI